MRWRVLALVAVLLGSTACQLDAPAQMQGAELQRYPASADMSLESRQAAVLATAEAELRCDDMRLLLSMYRRYFNIAEPAFVVEGCGQRATYAEICDGDRCRVLLLALLSVPGAEPAPAPAPTAAPPSSVQVEPVPSPSAPPSAAPAPPAANGPTFY